MHSSHALQSDSPEPLRVFTLETSRPFAEGVSRALGVPLSPHEERDFEDGEHKLRPLESVRNGDVFVIHSLYSDDRESVNDKLCKLLFFIGTLKDASPRRVTAVVPHLAFARKDRRTEPRDPVTTRYVAQLFEAVGVDRIVTLDVHNLAAYQNAFRCQTEHLEARVLFAEYFAGLLKPEAQVVVVSPDAGGMKRAEAFRALLSRKLGREVPLAFLEKKRSEGVVSGEALVGEVKGRVAVILDDLISTGTTLARAARRCRVQGAEHVWAAATHGLFSGAAGKQLAEPALERIVVTNTVPRLPEGPARAKVQVLEAAPLVAEAIRRLHTGTSLVELLAEGSGLGPPVLVTDRKGAARPAEEG